MKTEDTEVLGRELNQPDTVDQPVRTARIFVNHYNSTQYCKTETVFSIFPVLQTNITSQMCPLKMLKLDSLQLQHFRSHKKNQNRCHHADTFHRRSPAQNIRYLNKFGAVALSLTSLHGEHIALPILPIAVFKVAASRW